MRQLYQPSKRYRPFKVESLGVVIDGRCESQIVQLLGDIEEELHLANGSTDWRGILRLKKDRLRLLRKLQER
jgi:hypothetical protein